MSFNTDKRPEEPSNVRAWMLLCYIWGLQWIVTAAFDLSQRWVTHASVSLITLPLAALASFSVIAFGRKTASRPLLRPVNPIWRIALPAVVVAAGILLIAYAGNELQLVRFHLLRGLALSFFYVLLGTYTRWPLTALGFWLLALCGVTVVFYLGYVPLMVGLLGGLSLLVCGWMLRRWSRPDVSSREA